MKHFHYYLILMLAIISMGSCKKFLEADPTDFLSPSTYYNSEAQLKLSLNGVYDQLGSIGLYGNRIPYMSGFEADEGYYTRNTPTGIYAYMFTAGHPEILRFWADAYKGVHRANVLLANIDNNQGINQVSRDQIRGEALFLRGYYYFLLVQNFGPVPLILKPGTSVNNIEVPRTPAKGVYEQILKDMKEAEGFVPSIKTVGFGGRISKSAVRGILARVCLFMAGSPVKDVSKYAEARDWAKKVMEDVEAGHSLNPDFSQIFINYAQDKYDIKESIWEVEFWGSPSTYNETGYNGYVNGPASSNTLTGVGFGGVKITADLYRLYDQADLRRDWSIANFIYTPTGPSGSKTLLPSNPTAASLYDRYPAKYRREYELVIPKSTNSTPQNFPLLRYSDVLLMFAEAENEINNRPTPAAYNAINLVRKRGFGKLLPAATNPNQFDLSNLDKNSFFKEIVDERSRELCFEGLRKADLIRWGLFVSTMNRVGDTIGREVPSAFYYSWFKAVSNMHQLWPVPASELSLNNALVQNEGW